MLVNRGVILGVFLSSVPAYIVVAQEVDGDVTQTQQQSAPFYPLEIVIRPPRKVTGDGYYENGVVETVHGFRLRFSGYHIGGMHKRIIDGRLVYDVWQQERDLLSHNVMRDAGLASLPSIEERLAHELVYGNDIGERLGGEYKNMSFLEIAYSFNIDPLPPVVGFGGSGVYGDEPFNEDYSYANMMFGNISIIRNSASQKPK